MFNLISPEYSFERFCHLMLGKDPTAVLDAASAEITYARRNHRETTKDADFRKGSRGRAYCDNLQRLVGLCMGSIPSDPTPDFLMTVKPLVMNLLQRWEIGDLRQFFADVPDEGLPGEVLKVIDFVTVVVSRRDVDSADIQSTLGALRRLTESPETARRFFERVEISFHGYDQIPQELFEIDEVRQFVYKLDEQFPYWLFFLSKRHLGLQCLLYSLLPPFLTEEGRAQVFPERINELLTRRWFPAMNQICQYVGFSNHQIDQLTDRTMTYITQGRLPLDG
jgi:hypothetical protein